MSKRTNREYLTLDQAQEMTGMHRTIEVVQGGTIRIRNRAGRERRYQWTPERAARFARMTSLRMFCGTHDYQLYLG